MKKIAIIPIAALIATIILSLAQSANALPVASELSSLTEQPATTDAETPDSGTIKQLKGSGRSITRLVHLTKEYSKIEASRAVKVVISDRVGGQIQIKGDDNIVPHIKVDTKSNGECLLITIDNRVKSIIDADITIDLPSSSKLREIDASAGVEVNIVNELNGKHLEIEATSGAKVKIFRAKLATCVVNATSGAIVAGAIGEGYNYSFSCSSGADINFSVLTKTAKADASSGANLQLSGGCERLIAEASSAAKINTTSLTVKESSDLWSSSGASIRSVCKGNTTANASSGSTIHCDCKGELKTLTSSGGKVKRVK